MLANGYFVRYTTLDELEHERGADPFGPLREELYHCPPHPLCADEARRVPAARARRRQRFFRLGAANQRGFMIVTPNKRVSDWAGLLAERSTGDAEGR